MIACILKEKQWNIKRQNRLKVLHKLYYSQRDISATVVEAVLATLGEEFENGFNQYGRNVKL